MSLSEIPEARTPYVSGGSVMLTLPKSYFEDLGYLQDGEVVEDVEGRLVVDDEADEFGVIIRQE